MTEQKHHKTHTVAGEAKTELLKEEKQTQIPRFRTREDDFVENRFPKQAVRYAALAVLVIACIVCGIKVLGITAAVIYVIVFIELLMGFFLGNSPSFVGVLLAFAMVLAGVFTSTTEAILIGAIVFLATILIVRDK